MGGASEYFSGSKRDEPISMPIHEVSQFHVFIGFHFRLRQARRWFNAPLYQHSTLKAPLLSRALVFARGFAWCGILLLSARRVSFKNRCELRQGLGQHGACANVMLEIGLQGLLRIPRAPPSVHAQARPC